jgi:hypothetical protein
MNNDGTLDLVTNGFGIEIWYGVGDGTFGPPQGFRGFGGRPHAIDVNSDGVVDIISDASRGVMYGERRETNRPPVANAGPDVTVSYTNLFLDEEDERTVYLTGILSSDPDQHRLDSEWRAPDGTVISNHDTVRAPQWAPGRYDLTLRVFDGRGGTSDDHMILTITGIPEIVLHTVRDGAAEHGAWSDVQDSTGASGFRKFNPDRGAAKVTMPAADPADYFEVWFTADPTQEYKLWIRGKAQNNSWSNDSAFVQFDSTVDASGAPAYRIGTTSALTFNLEECSGCGVAGWGWEDDGWGAVNQNGVTLRFAEGGPQRIRIQKREDGLSIDQIVLSAQRFKTTRPGKAKNDTTILPEAR